MTSTGGQMTHIIDSIINDQTQIDMVKDMHQATLESDEFVEVTKEYVEYMREETHRRLINSN